MRSNRYKEQRKRYSNPFKKFVLGIFILFTGILVLLDNFGLITSDLKHLLLNWPMLFISVGIINLMDRRSWFWGFVFLLIGCFFWISSIKGIEVDFHKVIVPVLFIGIGLSIIFHKVFHFNKGESRFCADFNPSEMEEVNIFGGGKHQININDFKGGKITAIFGGSEIDLSKADLSDGKNVIDILCVFGGVSLIIPAEWNVHVQVISILGGFADKRRSIPNTDPAKESKELYIRGIAIFGGGEIKSSL